MREESAACIWDNVSQGWGKRGRKQTPVSYIGQLKLWSFFPLPSSLYSFSPQFPMQRLYCWRVWSGDNLRHNICVAFIKRKTVLCSGERSGKSPRAVYLRKAQSWCSVLTPVMSRDWQSQETRSLAYTTGRTHGCGRNMYRGGCIWSTSLNKGFLIRSAIDFEEKFGIIHLLFFFSL